MCLGPSREVYMKKMLLTALMFIFSATLSYAVLEIPNAQPKMDSRYWNPVLDKTWDGLKKRNIEPYMNGIGSGLVHRPKSEYPGDAVSEAVGYGMLVALFANDQETFNMILEAGYKNLWSGCYLDWHLLLSGGKEYGAATDAEEDVALALIFAAKLVEAGKWQPYSHSGMVDYATHAKRILECMWSTDQITYQGTLAPGAGWGGDDFMNPGYFSPAWYKVFAEFDKDHDWNKVVNRSYEIIGNSPGYDYGLIPDWMRPDGGPTGSLGYNAYFDAKAFFKDAIRILWRVALDAIWFDDSRAKEFLQNSLNFINSKGGASAADFFQMDGSLLPAEDVWGALNGGTITRHRREHSHLTIGMWMTAAAAVGTTEDRASFSMEMAKFYDENADYFGLANDPSGAEEDTLHNEMYFDQFLAWFGVSLMTGVMNNVVENIDNPKKDVASDESDLLKQKEGIRVPQVANTLTVQPLENGALFTANQQVQWSVFDLCGKKLYSTNGNAMRFISKSKGIYVIRARFSDGSVQIRKMNVN